MRNARIDRIRGLAILIVIMSHTVGYLTWRFFPYLTDIASMHINGIYAVSMFFTVSGFLITQRLLHLQHLPRSEFFLTFYVQRTARLLPCLLLVFPLAWLLSNMDVRYFTFDHYKMDHFIGCVASFRYNVCIAQPGLPEGWNVLWSLSVEEMFYLGFPMIVFLCRNDLKRLVLVLFAIVIFGPIYRAVGVTNFYTYFGNFDQMAFGCLGAVWGPKKLRRGGDLRLSGILIIILVFFGTTIVENYVAAPSLIAIGTTLYLIGAAPSNESRLLLRPLEYAGSLSYEMYLFHLPILAVFIAPLQETLGAIPQLARYLSYIE